MSATKSSQNDEHAAYWERIYRETPVRTLDTIKEGAKQLLGVTSALQGLYFVAISVADIKGAIGDCRILAFFTLPVILWLTCLGLAISVFVPESHYIGKKPDRIEKAFRATASAKLRSLRWAQWILVLSMAVLFADMVVYLLWVPIPSG